MVRIFCLAVLWSLPTVAVAQDWALRADDRLLTRDEVAQLTEGQTLVFYDDGRSKFSAGGAYSYTYASGQSAFGRYRVEVDGTVCIDYRNGFSRCDRYVESGSRIVMLTEKGERFPIRPSASD
ncbi:hypothetical protein [Roseobacter sinensis]|uniref:Secreted protein n=1 Tax=Roseobacter sinensis TaxID=2931391 RepID=A0ABT3BE15_9RHOB|nr:hypothetical protein [Roseobacter sp. WL0113]MCV3271801.1 hypothetical protein [Roseobacter sp. WL0113]